MTVAAAVLSIPVAALLGLWTWRWLDLRRAARVWQALRRTGDESGLTFDAAMVAGLPEPARRYFLFTIKPGTAVSRIAEIRMRGEIGLGSREQPNFMPMRAHQIIAVPDGLVWNLRAGRGAMHFGGSDGICGRQSWTRFWLLGTLPVVRAGGDIDHLRSAFGRVVAEAVFFAPAALLPRRGISWEAVNDHMARVTVVHNDMTQSVDIRVADDGRPSMVVLSRWSNANPERSYRLQPFGGYLSEFREFDGYTLPTRIEGGNFIGTEAYFPFYKAEISDVKPIVLDEACTKTLNRPETGRSGKHPR